ncbi:hypothetical protein [Shouchella clausii]|nr:hypothetical protein [Shouchella clausii]
MKKLAWITALAICLSCSVDVANVNTPTLIEINGGKTDTAT